MATASSKMRRSMACRSALAASSSAAIRRESVTAVAHQQVDARDGTFHAAGGVQAGSQPESDLTAGDNVIGDAGDLFESPYARPC